MLGVETKTNLNNNEIVLLGLLAEAPCYGYEIDKLIAARGMREWTDIAFSSIYAVLRTLERKGLVEAKTELAGNRARKLYTLTRQGRRTLRVSVGRLLGTVSRPSDPLMLGIANIKTLDKDEAAALLDERRAALLRDEDVLQSKLESSAKDGYFVTALFDRALTAVRAEVDFIGRLRDHLASASTPTAKTQVKPEAAPPREPESKPAPVPQASRPVAQQESAPQHDIPDREVPSETESPVVEEKMASDEPKDTLF